MPNQHTPMDDRALAACLKRGEDVCYEQLVRRFGGRMMSVARRFTTSEADAQDVVQDAFLQAFRKIEQFEGRASLATWLHRITVNAALSRARTAARHPEQSLDALAEHFDKNGMRQEPASLVVDSIEKLVEKDSTRALVYQAIEALPERNRNLLLLRDVEGLSTEEAATALGISQGAVKTGLHRAREALKVKLADELRNVELT